MSGEVTLQCLEEAGTKQRKRQEEMQIRDADTSQNSAEDCPEQIIHLHLYGRHFPLAQNLALQLNALYEETR